MEGSREWRPALLGCRGGRAVLVPRRIKHRGRRAGPPLVSVPYADTLHASERGRVRSAITVAPEIGDRALAPERAQNGQPRPVAAQHRAVRPRAARTAPLEARHVGQHAALVQEHQALGADAAHPGRLRPPRLARERHVFAVLLGRAKGALLSRPPRARQRPVHDRRPSAWRCAALPRAPPAPTGTPSSGAQPPRALRPPPSPPTRGCAGPSNTIQPWPTPRGGSCGTRRPGLNAKRSSGCGCGGVQSSLYRWTEGSAGPKPAFS